MTSTPVEVGTLIVVILKAKNLPNKRHIGKQDPYCSVKLNSETRRTKAIKRGGQHPEWDEEVRFTIYEDVEDELARTATEDSTEDTPPPPPPKKEKKKVKVGKKMQLMCYADDPREPDLIGETVVDLTEVLTKGETDEWFTLTNKEKYCGEVYLELTFWSNEKPPEKHSTPQTSTFHPQYGGPGSFTPSTDLPTSLMHGSSGQNTPSPSRLASNNGTDVALPLPPSLRPSGSLAQINLYNAPYEQRNRYAEVDQLTDGMADLGVTPSRRRESFPVPVQIGPSEFGYTGGPKRHDGSFSTMSSSSSLSSIHSLGNLTGSRPLQGHQNSLSSLPETFARDDYFSGPPHNMGSIPDSFPPQPTYQLPQAPSTFVPAPQPQQTPHPSQYNVTLPASHPMSSGFTAPPPPSSSMSFHPPQPPPQLQLQPQYPTPSQTPLPYPAYASPHTPGPPYQYTPQDGPLPPPSFPLTTHATPQNYGQHATPSPPHQNQQPTPAHSAFQHMHLGFPTPPGSRPLPNPQAQQKPRSEQQPSSRFASPPPGPSPPGPSPPMGSGAVMYPSTTPFQPPGPPPPPPPPRRSSLPPTPTKTPSISYQPPPPPPPPPPLPLQNGVHQMLVSHLNPPPPLPPSLLPSHFRDNPASSVARASQQFPPAQQPPPAQQAQGFASWVPPPPPPNFPPPGFSSPPHAPPPSNFVTTPAQNQQPYYDSGPSNLPVRFPAPQAWDTPPQQYPPQHLGYESQDGWHQ